MKSISSLLYSVISAKLCLMYNNSQITFMFEKSESDNTLLFTVVQAIFLLIDASLESGVPKRVAKCWALRTMGECILWWSTPCLATNLTMLLELFKHLTINPEQRQANSNLKGSKAHKGATKPEWVRVGSSQTRFNPLRQVIQTSSTEVYKFSRFKALAYTNPIRSIN